jgi:hypothetical protein
MYCCITGRIVPDVSKDCSAFIFRVMQLKFFLHCLTLKMKKYDLSKHLVLLPHIPEDLNVQQHCLKNLKPHSVAAV